jgi:2,3-bisphosphoglycerate-independent phosphoglycerate mutase
VDACIGPVVAAALGRKARVIVTADHGNAEQLLDYDTGEIHTAHTSNPVPVIIADDALKTARLRTGKAIDVAPTILGLLGLPEPPEMSGKSLIIK